MAENVLQRLLLLSFVLGTWIFAVTEGTKTDGPCKTAADEVLKSGLIGAYLPTCKSNGYYSALQCHASTGICWCSDELGNPLLEDKRKSTDCSNPCFKKILDNPPPTILVHGAPEKVDIDVAPPNCDEQGYFAAKQCNRQNCWCVNKRGEKLNQLACLTD